MKLAETSRLRPLVPEHRPEIKIFLRQGVRGSIMFDKGPDGTGGSFRPQGQGSPVPIGKGVHLLLDDVRRRPDAPGKEGGHLENGNPDFLEPVTGGPAPGGLFNEPPAGGFLRKNVLDAFNALDHRLLRTGRVVGRREASGRKTFGPWPLAPRRRE